MGCSKKSFLSFLLSFCLVFSLISTMLVKPAEAKTVRIAVVSSLSGDVTVQKGGGSQRYDVYENMSLNEGDSLYTGSESSVTLNLSNGDGEITLGENGEINVSDLNSSNGAKKSKLKIWAGSLWVKVKSLAGYDDEFEVETPTAVMGVRGTQFYVVVDPLTGKMTMFVGAGKVAATTITTDENNNQSSKTTYLYPTQQISLDSRDEVEDLRYKVDFINVDQFIFEASPEVIKAMIKAKAESDKENDEFIAKKKKEIESGVMSSEDTDTTLVVKDLSELLKIQTNLRNLIGNIAKNAVVNNKIDKSDMNNVVEETNKKIDDPNRKLDLDHVENLDKNAGLDPEFEKKKQQELKLLEEKKKKKEQEQADELNRIKQSLDTIIKAMEEAKKKVEEANKQVKKDEDARAEEELKKQQSKDVPTPPSTVTSGGSGSSGGSSGSGGNGGGVTPKVTLAAGAVSSGTFNLNINMSDFSGTNDIYAVQVHLRYDNSSIAYSSEPGVTASNIFNAAHSTDLVKEQGGASQNELVYVITNFGTGVGNVSVSGTKTLVTIPFQVINTSVAEANIKVESITIARKDASNNVQTLNISADSINPVTINLNPASN